MLYNDISYVDKIEKVEISEISHLTQYERRFVKLVIDKIEDLDIDYLTNLINGEA